MTDIRYIVHEAEPWMGGWLCHAERGGVAVTNELWATTYCGALAAAVRAVRGAGEQEVQRAE